MAVSLLRIGPVLAQILVGLLLVWVVYRMSLWLMRKDQLVLDKRKATARQDVRIIDGFIDTPLIAGRVLDTRNPKARTYTPLPRSFNRRGGAQFTYYFWLYLGDSSEDNVKNRIILLRGDPTAHSYTRSTKLTDAAVAASGTATWGAPVRVSGRPFVKCPMISFGSSYDTLEVAFNTADNPDERIRIEPSRYPAPNNGSADDPSARHHVMKLIRKRWALLTFVFEDNVAITDFEDGIIVRFYINDIMYQVDKRRSSLRQNAGDLHLFPTVRSLTAPQGATPAEPDSGLKGSRIGDLTYRNYAMSMAAVREVFEAGPPTHFASDLAGHNELGEPLFLSVYNKLDVYNT
jgi:hypothetical protein